MRLSSSHWVIAQRVTTARDFLIRLANLREAVPTRSADGRGDADFFNTSPAMSYWNSGIVLLPISGMYWRNLSHEIVLTQTVRSHSLSTRTS